MEKVCRICGETKPLDLFSKRAGSRDGYRNDCKACVVVRTAGRDRREYLARYYREHPEKYVGRVRISTAEYHRRWRVEHPEQARAIVNRYTRNHKAAKAARQHERRAAQPMDDLARGYVAILLRDPCSYCPEPAVTIDHIVPISEGGTNNWWNLTGACKSCNSSKGIRSLLGHLLAA